MLKVEVIGNLGADAKLQTVGDQCFISFRVAHNVTITNLQGQKSTITKWISCTKNGSNDALMPFLRTGQKVYVRGNGDIKTYTDKQGITHAGFVVFVQELELCGGAVMQHQEAPQQPSQDDEPF